MAGCRLGDADAGPADERMAAYFDGLAGIVECYRMLSPVAMSSQPAARAEGTW